MLRLKELVTIISNFISNIYYHFLRGTTIFVFRMSEGLLNISHYIYNNLITIYNVSKTYFTTICNLISGYFLTIVLQLKMVALILVLGWVIFTIFVFFAVKANLCHDYYLEYYAHVDFLEDMIDSIFLTYRDVGNVLVKHPEMNIIRLGYDTELELLKDFHFKLYGIHKTEEEIEKGLFQLPYMIEQKEFVKFLGENKAFQQFLEDHPELRDDFVYMKWLADDLAETCKRAERAALKYLERRPEATLKMEEQQEQRELIKKVMLGGTVLVLLLSTGLLVVDVFYFS